MVLPAMSGGPIEQKAVAGPTATLIAGYISWALITYIPGAKDTFPADIQAQLPVFVAFVISAIAAYFAPHTHRADLAR